jgi:S-DNA-T family DNA segregation ATPase FtsK/SpoIIIE
LLLTFARTGHQDGDDIAVDIDQTATVGALAEAIACNDPRGAVEGRGLTLRIEGPGAARVLPEDRPATEVGLRTGQTIALVNGSGAYADPSAGEVAAALDIVAGPDTGVRHHLRRGTNSVGRGLGNDVVLYDPLVSKRHCRFNVDGELEVIDAGSVNGVFVDGLRVDRAVLRRDDEVTLGDTVLRVAAIAEGTASPAGVSVAFVRSPYLDPIFQGPKVAVPEPPTPPDAGRFPWIPLLAPLLMGAVLYMVTQSVLSIVFVALSPIMLIGTYFEQRLAGKKRFEMAAANFRAGMAQLAEQLDELRAEEIAVRNHEHPSAIEVVSAAESYTPTMWSRRPDRPHFLEVRLGVGADTSRISLDVPSRNDTTPELWQAVLDAEQHYATVEPVPLVASLVELGTVGVAGSELRRMLPARAVIAQLCGLHSPAELALAVMCSTESMAAWAWTKWLPHTNEEHSPVATELRASGAARCLALADDVGKLIDERGSDSTSDAYDGQHLVVVIDDDTPVDRAALVSLAERGPAAGVHVVWVAPRVDRLPAACGMYVDVGPGGEQPAMIGVIATGAAVPVWADTLDAPIAEAFARRLGPVVDAGAGNDAEAVLPRTASFIDHVGHELLREPDALIELWQQSDSLRSRRTPGRKRPEGTLRAYVGEAAGQPMVLDLRTHGPHALVGGTTGAGKSEFLQSWVIGMAAAHSPERVTFLFVDYKGGSAFGDCVQLPHSVGLVTDLTPHLVNRALRSLRAELRYREEVLVRYGAKDLMDLERRDPPDCPPSLVIVIDEFAALLGEVPQFVDGVIDVAQRGRSLGLHLIMATQRPAGVIKGSLRANTNLRVALRMADVDDAEDVVGNSQPAMFDPTVPGRGMAKLGPNRLSVFQSAYVGGWTTERPTISPIVVADQPFGSGSVWESEVPEEVPEPTGPKDLEQLVLVIGRATTSLGLPAPRKPWLEPLATTYDLARSPQSRTDGVLNFATADVPDRQAQGPMAFHPDIDGNMSVIGTGGSGKSAFLRTLAVAAGLGRKGGPCHVYGLDFGARGLDMLEQLPHVGSIVPGEDDERVARLLRSLRELIEDRAGRYATRRAGSISDYRELSGEHDEPRILVLVDGFPAFREIYELHRTALFNTFVSVCQDGRQVGVHVVIAADRVNAIPPSIASVVQRQLVLRVGEDQAAVLNLPKDAFAADSPPGRGYIDGYEVQVGILGGSPSVLRQSEAMSSLAVQMDQTMGRPPAPPVERQPDLVLPEAVPVALRGRPVLGVEADALDPVAWDPRLPMVVVGPPSSGRTTTTASLAISLRAVDPAVELVLVTPSKRSPLLTAVQWDRVAVGPDAAGEVLNELVTKVEASSEAQRRPAIFVEDLPLLVNTSADLPLEQLVKAARSGADVTVVVDGDVSSLRGSYGVIGAVLASRHGIALSPDQMVGDQTFGTPFPRVNRADFPPGRGLYVRGGHVSRVQVVRGVALGGES